MAFLGRPDLLLRRRLAAGTLAHYSPIMPGDKTLPTRCPVVPPIPAVSLVNSTGSPISCSILAPADPCGVPELEQST